MAELVMRVPVSDELRDTADGEIMREAADAARSAAMDVIVGGKRDQSIIRMTRAELVALIDERVAVAIAEYSAGLVKAYNDGRAGALE